MGVFLFPPIGYSPLAIRQYFRLLILPGPCKRVAGSHVLLENFLRGYGTVGGTDHVL
jgi:hypothetical protein